MSEKFDLSSVPVFTSGALPADGFWCHPDVLKGKLVPHLNPLPSSFPNYTAPAPPAPPAERCELCGAPGTQPNTVCGGNHAPAPLAERCSRCNPHSADDDAECNCECHHDFGAADHEPSGQILTREEYERLVLDSTTSVGTRRAPLLAHDAALRESLALSEEHLRQACGNVAALRASLAQRDEEVERLTQERDEAQSVTAGAILDAGASKSANYVFRQLAWACAKGRNGPLPPDIEWIRPQHREVGDMVISVLKQFQDRVATLESALRDAPHGALCKHGLKNLYDPDGKCTCWKHAVMERNP